MKHVRSLFTLLAAALLFCNTASAAIVFQDDFSGGRDPSWVTDRYAPPVCTTIMFEGNERLLMGVNQSSAPDNRPLGQQGTFYNTQGIQTGAVATSGQYWTMSVDVYFTAGMLAGDTLMRAGLWGNVTTGHYPIMSYNVYDPADPYNPDSAGITTRLEFYDSDTGLWTDMGTTGLVADAWNTMEIRGTNGGFEYWLNGVQIGSDSAPGATNLTTAFLEIWNPGMSDPNPYDPIDDYQVMFDNVTVTTVPEPGTAGLGALGLLCLLRKRRR